MNITAAHYYGVDFSRCKTYGASETGAQFVQAFGAINGLVIGEWKKFDPGKFLRTRIASQDIAVTQRLNEAVDPHTVASSVPAYALSLGDLEAMVRGYELREQDGTGLVIVGQMLNKQENHGGFVVVFFDIATREIVYYGALRGKARGFGLRNFWAGALFDALKSW